jgi:hypothetical protein
MGFVLIDGRRVGRLEPLPDWQEVDFMDFDRRVCATGMREYIRPRFASDCPTCVLPESAGEFVLVQELANGIRLRNPVTLFK